MRTIVGDIAGGQKSLARDIGANLTIQVLWDTYRWFPGFRDMIAKRAVDIIQPDVIKSGGILECGKIFALAEAWNGVATKDVDKFVSICADEDIMFPPNAPIVMGKQGVREYMSQLFATPGFAASQQPPQVEVSRAGDLAYTWDTAELTANDPKGNPVTQRMKHVAVWKKQPDGTWKIVADIWNFDPPPSE